MKIYIVCFGTIDQPYLKEGIAYYMKKLSHYTKLEVVEMNVAKGKVSKDIEANKLAEGELLLNRLKETDQLYLFDERGKQMTSVQFAHWIEEKQLYFRGDLYFCIGGSFGFSKQVYDRAEGTWSFSQLTFNHQMFRLMALEQIYRAYTIIKGEPYHHS